MSEDKKECVPPPCKHNEKIELDATCTLCQPYQAASEDRLSCETPFCAPNEILTEDGRCELCNPHEKADSTGR